MKKIIINSGLSKILGSSLVLVAILSVLVLIPTFSSVAQAQGFGFPPPPSFGNPPPPDLPPPPHELPPPPEPPREAPRAPAQPSCPTQQMPDSTFSDLFDRGLIGSTGRISVGSGSASITIFNRTDCPLPVSLASWKMFDRVLSHQTLFDGSNVVIPANSSRTLSVNLPNCMAQIDAYFGPVPSSPVGIRDFTSAFFQNNGSGYADAAGNFCGDHPTPRPDPALNASCSVSDSNINIKENVTWSASASGGNGSYTYSWSGYGSLTGNSSSVSKIYYGAGNKTATVVITSGSQSVSRTCSTTVVAPQNQALTASCEVNPSSINVGGTLTWVASVSGGTGSYTYAWNGTDSLAGTGNSVARVYSTAGTKTGTVTVTSGSESVTRTCSAVVNQNNVDDDLAVSCSASQSRIDVDEDVIWRANVSGGTGSYSYDWSGTDSLDGSSRNITWSYDDSGTKHATVTVTSGGNSASASCTTRVNDEDDEDDDLSVSCYASPSTAQVGSQIRWYVNVDGGDGDYDYDWSGTDGLNSSSRTPYKVYSTPGSKRATVTVTDGDGQEESDTCYVNINSVLAYSESYQAPLASAVYLSQVPYTGAADNMKLYSFMGILALLSAWIAYIVIAYKKEHPELN